MEGHDDTQDTQTSQDYTEWTDTSWDHADNCTDADGWSSDWSTDLWGWPCMETSGTTVDTAATGSRTVQSNALRKYFNVWWTDDVRVVSR